MAMIRKVFSLCPSLAYLKMTSHPDERPEKWSMRHLIGFGNGAKSAGGAGELF